LWSAELRGAVCVYQRALARALRGAESRKCFWFARRLLPCLLGDPALPNGALLREGTVCTQPGRVHRCGCAVHVPSRSKATHVSLPRPVAFTYACHGTNMCNLLSAQC